MTRSRSTTTIADWRTNWPPPPTSAGSRWAWGVGALVLALLLTVQLAHHYRLQLARDANVGPALRAVYSRLGMPLPPNWNLAAFELRQWGASESAPSAAGTMTVRASIRNGAAFAQPMPLLRLELEDRFGGTVARRDFQPAEYLKDPAQATRLLPAGAATEAELAIVGTTSEAVGYRLDVCLRDENGVVRCAAAGRRLAAFEPGATVSAPTAAGRGPWPAPPPIVIGPYRLDGHALLAPMAGVTDLPFRRLCRRLGAALAAGEMIAADPRLWDTAEVATAAGPHRRTGTARRADRGRRPAMHGRRRASQRRRRRAGHRHQHGLPGEEGVQQGCRFGAVARRKPRRGDPGGDGARRSTCR